MDDIVKLRMKVGTHEFEFEGPREEAASQFAAWKALIESRVPDASPPILPAVAPDSGSQVLTPGTGELRLGPAADTPSMDLSREELAKVFAADDKRGIVTLRIPVTGPHGQADAVILTLYGFLAVKGQDEIASTKLMQALEGAGKGVSRIDRPVAPYVRQGLLLQTGKGKGTKYRLTNTGVARARDILRPILETLI
jgi:hypothetical protein